MHSSIARMGLDGLNSPILLIRIDVKLWCLSFTIERKVRKWKKQSKLPTDDANENVMCNTINKLYFSQVTKILVPSFVT